MFFPKLQQGFPFDNIHRCILQPLFPRQGNLHDHPGLFRCLCCWVFCLGFADDFAGAGAASHLVLAAVLAVFDSNASQHPR